MDLLSKFENVKVNNADRIAQEDREFCEKHQDLYNKVLSNYAIMFEKISQLKEYEDSLFDNIKQQNEYTSNDYKSTHYGYHFIGDSAKKENFTEEIKNVHNKFISKIIDYFKTKYNVTLEKNSEKIINISEPKEDTYYGWGYKYTEEEIEKIKQQKETYEKEYSKYQDKLIALRLDYNVILDDIFIQLDGYSFIDKADKEIKDNCKKACYRGYHKDVYEFTLKNNKIIFDILYSYKCRIFNRYEVKLNDEPYLNILTALTYFDSDKCRTKIYVDWQYRFVAYQKTENDGIYNKFEINTNKINQFKYAKNGKWEVTFTSPEYARQFAKEYCGYIEQ